MCAVSIIRTRLGRLVPVLILGFLLLLPVNGSLDKEQAKELEEGLLKMLKMTHRPRPTRGSVVIPPALLELYRMQTGLDIDTTAINAPGRHSRSSNTVRTYLHQESELDKLFHDSSNHFRLQFDLNLPNDEALYAAELQLSRNISPDISNNTVRVLVNEIISPGVKGHKDPIYRLLDSKIFHERDTVISLDVLPAVQRWRTDGSKNHGLYIKILTKKTDKRHNVRLKRSISDQENEFKIKKWGEEQPVLLTYTDDIKPKKIVKRGVPTHNRRVKVKNSADNCRRHALTVNFEEVGWTDWIVAPPGYDAYFCRGDCPFPLADHLNTTNHAVVQTLMNSMNPGLVPKACCVPTELSSITMLYLDEQSKVVLKKYNDMAVESCGCR